MLLVGFTIETHYDARSCKRQYCLIVEISVLAFQVLLVQCHKLADTLNVLMWEHCRSELGKSHVTSAVLHLLNTDMRRITTGMRSEICVVRRFRRCANVIECTYTNLDSTV